MPPRAQSRGRWLLPTISHALAQADPCPTFCVCSSTSPPSAQSGCLTWGAASADLTATPGQRFRIREIHAIEIDAEAVEEARRKDVLARRHDVASGPLAAFREFAEHHGFQTVRVFGIAPPNPGTPRILEAADRVLGRAVSLREAVHLRRPELGRMTAGRVRCGRDPFDLLVVEEGMLRHVREDRQGPL